MLNGSLKIGELIFMRDLENLRVVRGEPQSELEILLLFILRQSKPVHDGDAHNVMIDYMFDCFEGKRVFVFSEFRSRAFAMLSQIRRTLVLSETS